MKPIKYYQYLVIALLLLCGSCEACKNKNQQERPGKENRPVGPNTQPATKKPNPPASQSNVQEPEQTTKPSSTQPPLQPSTPTSPASQSLPSKELTREETLVQDLKNNTTGTADFSNKNIGDKGAAALAEGLKRSAVTRLC